MQQKYRYSFKVCLLGDAAVGKTSLIRRFVQDEFHDDYIATIGTKVSKKTLTLPHPSERVSQTLEITLTVWDIVGQPGLHTLRSMYYTGADGALVVADPTREETIESVESWVASLFGKTGRVPLILLANKSDLAHAPERFESLSSKLDARWLATSARTGQNVEEAFSALTQQMVSQSLTERITTPIEVLDILVADFCALYGGLEEGMLPFRESCEAVGVSFCKPTIAQLEALNRALRERLLEYLDETRADAFYRKHQTLLDQLEDG